MGLILLILIFYLSGVIAWFALVSAYCGEIDEDCYKSSVWSWGLVVLFIIFHIKEMCSEEGYNIYVE